MVYSAAKFQQSNTYQYPTDKKSAETFWSTYVLRVRYLSTYSPSLLGHLSCVWEVYPSRTHRIYIAVAITTWW